MNFGLVRQGALSARRDNVLAGRASNALGEHISDLSSSRVSQSAKRVVCLARQMPLAKRIYLAERVINYLTFSSLT